MPMQSSPIADTFRPLFPSVRCVFFGASFEIPSLVSFPRHPPMFVGTGRGDDQLIRRKLVPTLQVFSHQTSNHGSFDVERPGLRAFVNVIPAIRGFVSPLRVLDRS